MKCSHVNCIHRDFMNSYRNSFMPHQISHSYRNWMNLRHQGKLNKNEGCFSHAISFAKLIQRYLSPDPKLNHKQRANKMSSSKLLFHNFGARVGICVITSYQCEDIADKLFKFKRRWYLIRVYIYKCQRGLKNSSKKGKYLISREK